MFLRWHSAYTAILTVGCMVSLFVALTVLGPPPLLSAQIHMYDVNGRRLIFQDYCVGFWSRDGLKQMHWRCGIDSGSVTMGGVPKGSYLLHMWLGEVNTIEKVFYDSPIDLVNDGQVFIVTIPNIRQDIEVRIGAFGGFLPKTYSKDKDVVFRSIE